MSVVEALERELKELAERDEALASSTLAASALALAAEIDEPGNSATSKAMCSKALNETMTLVRELAPPKRKADGVDDLVARRQARRSTRSSAAKPAARS